MEYEIGIAFLNGHAADESLTVSKTEVFCGNHSYHITILGTNSSSATIRYSLNGNAPQEFDLALDSFGDASIHVGADTPKGTYRILAFRPFGTSEWLPTDSAITVR